MNAPPPPGYPPPPSKRERRQPTRINREIPRSEFALMMEVARGKFGGDTKPVICLGLRLAHKAYLEELAEEARLRAVIDEANDSEGKGDGG